MAKFEEHFTDNFMNKKKDEGEKDHQDEIHYCSRRFEENLKK